MLFRSRRVSEDILLYAHRERINWIRPSTPAPPRARQERLIEAQFAADINRDVDRAFNRQTTGNTEDDQGYDSQTDMRQTNRQAPAAQHLGARPRDHHGYRSRAQAAPNQPLERPNRQTPSQNANPVDTESGREIIRQFTQEFLGEQPTEDLIADIREQINAPPPRAQRAIQRPPEPQSHAARSESGIEYLFANYPRTEPPNLNREGGQNSRSAATGAMNENSARDQNAPNWMDDLIDVDLSNMRATLASTNNATQNAGESPQTANLIDVELSNLRENLRNQSGNENALGSQPNNNGPNHAQGQNPEPIIVNQNQNGQADNIL